MLPPIIRPTLLLLILFTSANGVSRAVANEDPFGLDAVLVMSDDEGEEVRGLSSATQSFGVSFLSGILFDPDTGSVARAHSLETTASVDSVDFNSAAVIRSTLVSWQRALTLDLGLSINNFQAIMAGATGAQGFASSLW